MSNQNKLTVSILGRSYSLLTDERHEIVEEAATLVESYLKSMGGSTTSPAEMVKKTTFVALKVAVDLVKERNELQLANNKANSLSDLIKNSLN